VEIRPTESPSASQDATNGLVISRERIGQRQSSLLILHQPRPQCGEVLQLPAQRRVDFDQRKVTDQCATVLVAEHRLRTCRTN